MRRQTSTASSGCARRALGLGATVVLGLLSVATVSGCSIGRPSLACAAVDAAAFSSPEQLAHASDAVVRGHVDGVITPRAGTTGVVTETYSLAVDDVLAVADGQAAPAVRSVVFVAMSVLDPRCPGGSTPTPGYADFPLAGEVPAAGTDVIVFLSLADVSEGGVPTSLGYASVGGDRATFAGVSGDLRGKSYGVDEVGRDVAQGLGTAGPTG